MKKIGVIIGIVMLIVLGTKSCGKDEVIVETTPETNLEVVEIATAAEYTHDTHTYTLIGEVRSANQIELKAETAGPVKRIYREEGQEIFQGDVILEIENKGTEARVKQAEGMVISAQAQLDKLRNGSRIEEVQILRSQLNAAQEQMIQLKKGAREEEVKITEINIANTTQSLEDAKKVLTQTERKVVQDKITVNNNNLYVIESASTVADKAMGFYLQNIVIDGNTTADCHYKLLSSNKDSYGRECVDAFDAKDALHQENNLIEAKNHLITIQNFLEPTLHVVEGAISERDTKSITPEALAIHKNNVLAAQAELEASINQIDNQLQARELQRLESTISITNAENRVHELENTLDSLKQELIIKRTGGTSEEIAIQQAQIDQISLQLKMATEGARYEDIRAGEGSLTSAYADLNAAQAEKEKTMASAPFNGKILDIPIEVGDFINIGSVIAQIGDTQNLEVITYISEKEEGSLKLGDRVTLETPHGYTEADVIAISPSIDPTYKKIKVTLRPIERTKKLTIGRNIRVKLPRNSQNYISIPLTAVKFSGENAYILTVNKDSFTEAIEVEIGNTMGGNIEIHSGITELTPLIIDARGIQEGEEVEIKKQESR